MICLLFTPMWASAVRPTSALYDETGITTTIDATCIGSLLVNHDMEWQQSNSVNGNVKNNTLANDETRAIFTYRENTLAASGSARYTKEYSMDGSNVSEGRDNLNARHTINYQSDPTQSGAMLWDEEGTISLAGHAINSLDTGRCVFATNGANAGAGFIGSVDAGSMMNVEEVAAVTQLGARAISPSSTVPVSLRYSFDAQGLDTDNKDRLATGSAEVTMNTNFEVFDTKARDSNTTTMIKDRQRTVARGLFDLAQTVGYASTY